MTIPNCDSRRRADWRRDLHDARQNLDALYFRGLRRDFIPEAAIPPAPGGHAPWLSVQKGEDVATGLDPWQRELILRLEHGLARRTTPADMTCISWNPTAVDVGRCPAN